MHDDDDDDHDDENFNYSQMIFVVYKWKCRRCSTWGIYLRCNKSPPTTILQKLEVDYFLNYIQVLWRLML